MDNILNNSLLQMNLSYTDEEIIRNHRIQKIIKRILDIIISIPLLIIASPVLIVSCVAICIESKGSPIYKQTRFGYREKNFTIYKLRTMYEHSSEGNLAAPKAGDVRVTKVGLFLRKTSIDELPQLFNVIRGDMSILGPRAVPEKEITLRLNNLLVGNPDKKDFFEKAMHIRMLVRPGISGMAQAYGRSSLSVEEATRLDVYYAMNCSLGLDLRIFIKTIETVVFQKGVN